MVIFAARDGVANAAANDPRTARQRSFLDVFTMWFLGVLKIYWAGRRGDGLFAAIEMNGIERCKIG